MMTLLSTEFIKLKNTFALWLTIAGSSFVPIVLFATYLSDIKAFVPYTDVNPWDDFLVRTLNGCCFFSVGFVLLIIGLIVHIEHKANAWKQLFTLPLSRGSVYLGKLLLTFTMIFLFFALYLTVSILSGTLLGYIVPDLGFSNFKIPFSHLFRFFLEFFISILPMVFLQFWLSFRLRNLITSLGVGLGGLMVGLLLKNWQYIDYLPYAPPFKLLNYGEVKIPGHSIDYLSGAVYTILLAALSYQDFSKRFQG